MKLIKNFIPRGKASNFCWGIDTRNRKLSTWDSSRTEAGLLVRGSAPSPYDEKTPPPKANRGGWGSFTLLSLILLTVVFSSFSTATVVSAKSVKSENKTIKKNEKRLLKDNFQPTAKNDRQNKEDRDEDDDDNKKISASSKSDGLNQNREKKCEKIAWGHLIAPGWLKKNFAPAVSGCQNIPWGIVKKW